MFKTIKSRAKHSQLHYIPQKGNEGTSPGFLLPHIPKNQKARKRKEGVKKGARRPITLPRLVYSSGIVRCFLSALWENGLLASWGGNVFQARNLNGFLLRGGLMPIFLFFSEISWLQQAYRSCWFLFFSLLFEGQFLVL